MIQPIPTEILVQNAREALEVDNLHPQPLELHIPTKRQAAEILQTPGVAPETIQKIEHLREKFTQASDIITVCGEFGLGDTLLDVRYAIQIALKTDKNVICQVQSALLPVFDRISTHIPNITFVNEVDTQKAVTPSTFLVKFQGGNFGLGSSPFPWLAPSELNTAEIQQYFDQKNQENSIGYWYYFLPPFRLAAENNLVKEETLPTSPTELRDFDSGLMLQMLGVDVHPDDIEAHPSFSVSDQEFSTLPQDVDVFLIPDAKEFNSPDRSRSKKSLDISLWEVYFAQLQQEAKFKKVVIVRGISHPFYCDQVIQLALRQGFQVEEVSGNLLEIGKQMLRAKKIIGMDSGTSHLALDVTRFAALKGRQVDFSSLFYNLEDFYKTYGIVGADTILTHDQMTREQQLQVVQFMLEHS